MHGTDMERGFRPAPENAARRRYLVPVGFLRGPTARAAVSAGAARWLAGGPVAFGGIVAAERKPGEAGQRHFRALDDSTIDSSLLHALSAPRASWAGFDLKRPLIMGIVNVTPDSFSDGGEFADPQTAIAHGIGLAEQGADILDVGGESTRPGSAPVSIEEERRRVIPVVRALAERGLVVSIDSRHARIMEEAIAAGAKIINDVTALTGDPASPGVAARSGAALVLMHMLGEPQTMQLDPKYADATLDLIDYFSDRLAVLDAAGIVRRRIALDPGIGFGKKDPHNLLILDELAAFQVFGCAVALGVSRKSFLGRLSRGEGAKDRLAGSLAVGTMGLERGVQILRVHDVAETFQARALWLALGRG